MKKFIIGNTKIALVIITSIGIMISGLVGCTTEEKKGNYRFVTAALPDSGNISTNSNHELYWDKDAKAVLLKSLKTGKVWSDIVYEAYSEGSVNANINSPISITVINNLTLKTDTISSYDAINNNGTVLCKKIDNGLRVTYFFDNYKIAVPVEYVLENDCLSVSVDGSNILEDATDYKLVSVTLTPNLCAVSNQTEDAYVFVPSGSGALMYAKEDTRGTRKYSSEVYGADASRQVPEDFTENESVRLPVFGSSDGNFAMLGIISMGAGSAFIEAQAGNSKTGYSNVGATFYFRGYDVFRFASHGTGNVITKRVNENISKERKEVKYYPLYGEDANYNSMAKKYREYLEENFGLEKNECDTASYSLSIYGGTNVTNSSFGIPKQTLTSMTSFSEALEIIEDTIKVTGVLPVVRMMGYGDNGITPGLVGGGKNYPSVYGKASDIEKLHNYVSNNSGTLFMDSDIVRFSTSGNGFSINKDCSFTAIKHKSEQYLVDPIRLQDKDFMYRIISRSSLNSAMEKIVEKAQKYKTKGISLSTLGSTAFSDYDSEKYILKANIENDVNNIFKNLKNKGYTTAASSANSYAACGADVLFDIPTDNGEYDVFDVNIPFYQMVFHSYKPMYSEPVNLSGNKEKDLMLAIVGGMGVDFSIIKNYIDQSDDLKFYKLYAMVYSDNSKLVEEFVSESGFDDCYTEVKNSVLDKYEILDNGLSVSHFDNGTVIYANHTSKIIDSPIGELKAYGFGKAQEEEIG